MSKPYIHNVYKLKADGLPGQFIETIKHKKTFIQWALDYILKNEQRICFRLDSWPEGIYKEPIPFPKRKGKIGLVFVSLDATRIIHQKGQNLAQ